MGEEEEEGEQETRGDPRPASPSSAEKYILVSSRQLSCVFIHFGHATCGCVIASSTWSHSQATFKNCTWPGNGPCSCLVYFCAI